MQSRNFRLQRVGDINWLERNYHFQEISFSLDELMVVDATRGEKDIQKFAQSVRRLVNNVFIPVAAGGGITNLAHADLLFENGADKVIVNTALIKHPDVVAEIVNKYGTQSLIASIDYKYRDGVPEVLIKDGSESVDMSLSDYINYVASLNVGEILLNSIDKDGTGFGYDMTTLEAVTENISTPLILMGGAGNERHLEEGLQYDFVSAVATANLFNFIGNGLPNARQYLLKQNANLANWE
ncbi:MAG: HisA/HisF-related TIM barrel protein [Aestuariibacter sp.]